VVVATLTAIPGSCPKGENSVDIADAQATVPDKKESIKEQIT
jgi:hypothetical protein